jgi:hypothetical protein
MPKSRTSSRRKTQTKNSLILSIKLPPKQVREKFLIIYELEGCQKAVTFLTKNYGVRKMKIFLDGKRVGKDCIGCYVKNRAYFTKEGMNKRIVLHELYHHLVESNGLELSDRAEEKEANHYAKSFLKKINSIGY